MHFNFMEIINYLYFIIVIFWLLFHLNFILIILKEILYLSESINYCFFDCFHYCLRLLIEILRKKNSLHFILIHMIVLAYLNLILKYLANLRSFNLFKYFHFLHLFIITPFLFITNILIFKH